jgi:hypothetical protein
MRLPHKNSIDNTLKQRSRSNRKRRTSLLPLAPAVDVLRTAARRTTAMMKVLRALAEFDARKSNRLLEGWSMILLVVLEALPVASLLHEFESAGKPSQRQVVGRSYLWIADHSVVILCAFGPLF